MFPANIHSISLQPSQNQSFGTVSGQSRGLRLGVGHTQWSPTTMLKPGQIGGKYELYTSNLIIETCFVFKLLVKVNIKALCNKKRPFIISYKFIFATDLAKVNLSNRVFFKEG